MGEIRIVGTGETRRYQDLVCKKRLVLPVDLSILIWMSPFLVFGISGGCFHHRCVLPKISC